MPAACVVFLLPLLVCLLCVVLIKRSFSSEPRNMGGEKKLNGDANQVDRERNRRASIFLPIKPLKMAKINTSRFDVSKGLGERKNRKYTWSG